MDGWSASMVLAGVAAVAGLVGGLASLGIESAEMSRAYWKYFGAALVLMVAPLVVRCFSAAILN